MSSSTCRHRQVRRAAPASWLPVIVGAALMFFVAACASASNETTASGQTVSPAAEAPTPSPAPTAAVAEPSPAPSPGLVETESPTRLAYGTEAEQFGWLHLPAGPPPAEGFPVVVLIHGGFWRQGFDASLMDALADDLVDRGYASWNIEYRRVGGSGGWPMTGDDVAASVDFLATIAQNGPLDLGRMVSVGHSAGGHLGLWQLGQHGRVELQGSVGLGAVVDLAYFPQAQALLGGTPDQVPQVYMDAAPVLDAERVILIQGASDSIVPLASLQLADDAGVPIVVIDGENHFDLIDPSSASWAATITAIETFVNPTD